MACFKLNNDIGPYSYQVSGDKAMIKIPVVYVNGQRGMVSRDELNMLIKARKIISFRRSSGWVRVAFNQLRGEGDGDYSGPDRRNNPSSNHFSMLRYIFTTSEVNRYNIPHQNFMNRLFKGH